jgi:uncharacterized protein
MAQPELNKKLNDLKKMLLELKSAVIAYSGGVDSTFLIKIAHDVLDGKALAITAVSPTYPDSEAEDAIKFAKSIGIKHIVVQSNEMDNPNFVSNPSDRCYYCKTELFNICLDYAKREGINVILDGTNADDDYDYRPGRRAAIELNVISPLKEVGLTKEEIRFLSKEMGLGSWDKPSFACLSSRFPYGTKITLERLEMVGEAENFLRSLGFRTFRVRYHNDIARLELGNDESEKILNQDIRKRIIEKLKSLGFIYVTLDLEGYRTGSMNELLKKKQAPVSKQGTENS